MSLKKGDLVKVIAGKDKGKSGKVLSVNTQTNRIVVEGVGIVKKHLKPGRSQKNPEGGILEQSAPIDRSNVALVEASAK